MPSKKVSKQKLKFKNKPWITLELQKSISIKNHLLSKYIKLKDSILTDESQMKNKLCTLYFPNVSKTT